jgi:hypothetical protein
LRRPWPLEIVGRLAAAPTLSTLFFTEGLLPSSPSNRITRIASTWPIVDFGIRGLDLVYALLDACDIAILVDAVSRGGPAGTLYVS